MKILRMSILNEYETCPYKCKQEYGEVGQEAPERGLSNVYAEFGSLLHEVFEFWGNKRIQNEKVTLSDLYNLYNVKLQSFKNVFPGGKRQEWIQKGYEQIDFFYEKFTEQTPLAVEKSFDLEGLIDGIELPFHGTIDRIDKSGDGIHLKDYKTGKKYTKRELKDNIQATVYSLAIQKIYGELPKDFTFIFTKERKVQEIKITPSFIEKGIERVKRDYLAMENNIWIPNPPSQFFCNNFCDSKDCPSKNKKNIKLNNKWDSV